MITTIYISDPAVTLHLGDAHDVLATMPTGLADCIVTSPPYWSKRDYGMTGQYGHEPSPAAYVETLRTVFHEARRVLADDGTCWLNLGDSYSCGGATPSGLHTYLGGGLAGRHAPGLGAKNLLGLPWRTALALQADGWIIRNAIIWHKPNAMPESVRDRLNCRKAARNTRRRAAPRGRQAQRHKARPASRRRRSDQVRPARSGGHRRPALRDWPQQAHPSQRA